MTPHSSLKIKNPTDYVPSRSKAAQITQSQDTDNVNFTIPSSWVNTQQLGPGNQHNRQSGSKPTVMLVGNSLINEINPRALSPSFYTEKVKASKIDEAIKVVEDSEIEDIQCVCAQLITNDCKDVSNMKEAVDTFTEKLDKLVSLVHSKWAESSIVLSLGPPRGDSNVNSDLQSLFNTSTALHLQDKEQHPHSKER